MVTSRLTIALFVLLVVSGLNPESAASAPEKEVEMQKVLVEGVASSGQASPVSVLREIGERIRGRSFSVMYGKYVAFLNDPVPPSLVTDRTRLIGIKQLPTGLFKATMEVEIAADLEERLDLLRERTQPGRGDPVTAGSLILAREEAREDALERGILAAVAEQYPGASAPSRLAGRIYFLGTIREEIEEGDYVILARLKVRLFRP